jgi:hypothetical protein
LSHAGGEFSLPVRNGQTGICKQALLYKFKGKINIGSPPKRWRDQLHLDGQGIGTVPDASEVLMMKVMMMMMREEAVVV